MKDLLLQNCRLDGRYDVRERLGRGSYAEIYVAEDTLASPDSPHKLVVIKALNVFMQNDLDIDLERTLVENFQNEAIALDRVRHPNILSRLGHGTAQDLRGTVFHYLVLEYLSGGDLARYCRQKSLSLFQALIYIEQVCAGLGHAHKNDVIHRDIKPQNILLTEDNKIVKIADFGVARVNSSDSPLSNLEVAQAAIADSPITRVGTNMYAPPEHSPMLSGETQNLIFSELTPAADIYSLAKSTYVLITGESPRFFTNQPITELPHSIRQKPWAEALLNLLNKSTQTDSRKRPQTVIEFWKELSSLKNLADNEDADAKTRATVRLHTIPQAHVAKGFTPNAPIKPKFNTSKELKLKEVLSNANKKSLVVTIPKPTSKPESIIHQQINPKMPVIEQLKQVHELEQTIKPKPKRKFARLMITAILLFGLFAGSLYSTYNYMLGRGFSFSGSSQQLGIATTDINLRPEPTTRNAPIGLITADSRLKIIQRDDNWYEVIITQHGRPKANPDFADRGWAYGKYIKIDD